LQKSVIAKCADKTLPKGVTYLDSLGSSTAKGLLLFIVAITKEQKGIIRVKSFKKAAKCRLLPWLLGMQEQK
jgi:hypothetical protein